MALIDEEDDLVPFTVWRQDSAASEACSYKATSAVQAAEYRAREEYRGDPGWRIGYRVRDGVTGRIWDITVGVVQQPSFVAMEAAEVLLPSSTHVLWGGAVLCEDLRLRGAPASWPDGQRWLSLADVADGHARPPDACEACWAKAPGLVDEIRQIGRWNERSRQR